MNSTEKVVKWLELCLASIDKATCPEECPYYETCRNYENRVVFQPVMRDALELLKRQRPMQVVMNEKDKLQYGRCPACFRILTPWHANYCSICGQAVKWDG